MKVQIPDGYGKYLEYDFNNRISYDKETDSMYIYVAPPQGQVGTVMVYSDKQNNMISIDTDEVNTQVGIEIIGLTRLIKKFKNYNEDQLCILARYVGDNLRIGDSILFNGPVGVGKTFFISCLIKKQLSDMGPTRYTVG